MFLQKALHFLLRVLDTALTWGESWVHALCVS